ncbi:hypothetical protein ACOAKC_06530 [Hathewaya histolytica]|uniref:hypothetical protein n=1 Tax=Hathewaya histolytica TaxID=1498 RepID=UPI003B679533
MGGICDLNAREVIILTSILTLAFSEDKTADELNALGNVLVAIGTNFLTIAAIEQCNKDSLNNMKKNNNKEGADKDTPRSNNSTD